MDGRIKDGKRSGNYEKSLPPLFNPSLTLLCTCSSLRLFSGFSASLLLVMICQRGGARRGRQEENSGDEEEQES